MIFSLYIFKKCKTDELYKTQMKGLKDNTITSYNPMLISSIFKREFRENRQEQEFIESYLESAKIISKEVYRRQKNNMGVEKIFYSYSLVLPVVYLCRHSIELAIKRAIRLLDGNIKFNHSLLKQWNSLREYLNKYNISVKDRDLMNFMGEFINNIELLDDNGIKLRYPKQQDNSYSQQEFLWVDTKNIVNQTELFIRQLEYIKIDKL